MTTTPAESTALRAIGSARYAPPVADIGPEVVEGLRRRRLVRVYDVFGATCPDGLTVCHLTPSGNRELDSLGGV